jgi:type I restriction enzyme S subunit
MSAAVRAGYKQTEIGVIPEDWQVKQFSEVTDLITCGIAATPTYVSESQGFPFLSSTNVKNGRVVWSNYKYISRSLHRLLYTNNPPKRGDVLYSRVGTIGEAAVVEVDFEFSVYVSLTLIKLKQSLDSDFLKHLLNSAPYKFRAKDQVYLGGGVGNLNVDVVRKYPIVLPRLPEQRAIATALSDLDALLAKLDALIAKKRDLKVATMQQLLTGQTRLPGFSGEWEVKRLGDIVEIRKGQLITEKDAVFGEIPVIAGGKKPSYFHNQPNRNGKTITVSASGASAGYVAFFDSPIFASDCSTIGESKTYSIEFIYFQLLLKQEVIFRAQTGGAQPHIHAVDLMPLEIGTCTIEEQTAIAIVLKDMDTEIEGLESRRDKTYAIKQGMMQELLTGRVRLV